jgi:hypothetical protein
MYFILFEAEIFGQPNPGNSFSSGQERLFLLAKVWRYSDLG